MKEAGAELEDEYFKSLNPKRGEYIYADSAATDPKISKKHLTHILWAESICLYKCSNFKALFFRSTNAKSTKLVTNMGGVEVKKVYFKKKGIENEFISLIRIDFDKLNIHSLSQLYGTEE